MGKSIKWTHIKPGKTNWYGHIDKGLCKFLIEEQKGCSSKGDFHVCVSDGRHRRIRMEWFKTLNDAKYYCNHTYPSIRED